MSNMKHYNNSNLRAQVIIDPSELIKTIELKPVHGYVDPCEPVKNRSWFKLVDNHHFVL